MPCPKRRANLFEMLPVEKKLISVKVTSQFDGNVRAVHEKVQIIRFEFGTFKARDFREPVWNRKLGI
jgi:hypothetical protein